jgi:hypothetical protein
MAIDGPIMISEESKSTWDSPIRGLIIKRPEWCSIRIVLMRGDALVPYTSSIVHIWFVTLSCDHRVHLLVCFVQSLLAIREAATFELSYVNGQQHGARQGWYADQTGSRCLVEHLSRQMESHQVTASQESEVLLVCPIPQA